MSEYVDVDFDEGEVEKHDQEVYPDHVVQFADHSVQTALPLVGLLPLHLKHVLGHVLVHLMSSLPDSRFAAFQFLSDHFEVSVLFEPVSPNSENDCSHEDGQCDDDPGELVAEEVGSLLEQPVFSIDILSIDSGNAAVGHDVVERPFCEVLEGVGADVKAVEVGQKYVELLGKVHVDEHYQGQLLHVLNSLEQEVLLVLGNYCENGQDQGGHYEENYQSLGGKILTGGIGAVAEFVLVGRVVAVAHAVDGKTAVTAVGTAAVALVVIGTGAVGRRIGTGVVALAGDQRREEGESHQQDGQLH